jgi:histidinol-phosphatase (PHP family)
MRANYHTHSLFCDGKASPAAMAQAAKSAGYAILGFSSHAPFAREQGWTMKPERLGEYATEVRRLAAAWADGGAEAAASSPMEILLGLEVDWFPEERRPGDGPFAAIKPDFLIGAVHSVELEGTPPFTVDSSQEHFDWSMSQVKCEEGAARAVYKDYYRRLGALIRDGGFDILAHFDLVKKNNADYRVFDEGTPDYLDAAFEAASYLAGKDIVAEVNLGGMARGKTKEPYPSLPIMKELKRLGVRITFSADAHLPEHIGSHLEAARTLAKASGYTSIVVLSHGQWREVGIDET